MKTKRAGERIKKSEKGTGGRRTLASCINDILIEVVKKYNLPEAYNKVENFVTDDKESANFIRLILHDDVFDQVDANSPLYEITQARARHSAITFLIGLVFRDFGGLFDAFSTTRNVSYDKDISFKLWMITALNHDRGLYSEYIKKTGNEYKTRYKLDLFTDE